MITKEDFWKTINDGHPNIAVNSIESIRELSKVISSIAFHMLPDRLYQYRSFSSDSDSFESCSHNVTHLINDEIWGTKISKVNDQYEIFPYFGTQEMNQLLQEGINLQEDFASITEEKARKSFPIIGNMMGDDGYRLFVEFCKDKRILTLLSELVDLSKKSVEKLDRDFILQGVRARLAGTYLACFTENDFSTLMEAHYSKGSTGFVVEYDSHELIQQCDKIDECDMRLGCRTGGLSVPLYPVNYTNERIDLSNIIAVSMFYTYTSMCVRGEVDTLGWEYLDYLADLKIVCWKKKEWEYEKEWRMISFSLPGCNDGADYIPLKKAKASSVSVFERTSTENIEFMKEICIQKGIPLYLLKEDINSKSCNTYIKDRIV